MQLNRVDLPQPFGPMMPRISPSFTSNETPSTAWMPPKLFLRSRTSRTALIGTVLQPALARRAGGSPCLRHQQALGEAEQARTGRTTIRSSITATA